LAAANLNTLQAVTQKNYAERLVGPNRQVAAAGLMCWKVVNFWQHPLQCMTINQPLKTKKRITLFVSVSVHI
jgi:hypothetical protein